MKDQAAPTNQNLRDGVTLLELGRIEHKYRLRARLTKSERSIRDAALEMEGCEGSTRGIILGRAALLYEAYCEQQVRDHGGRVERETQRIGLGGRRTIERRVTHFPPKPVQAADPARRSRPRARGAGRPKAQSTRSSAKSGDSGDDGLGESDDPPPRRRLCECGCGADISHRAAQARHLNDTHAAADRQRRKRVRDRARDPGPKIDDGELLRLLSKATCACNGHHVPDDDDVLGQRCSKCGRQRPESPLGQKLLGQLAALLQAVA